MDLQSMAHKLEGGKYADRFAFQADFRLMMANAKLYNPVGSFAHDETLALETYFEKRMYSVFQNTVTSAQRRFRMDYYQQNP
jgi:transcription initiation factor TFIID subunit 2